jgi:hypothetical protein
MIKTKIKKLEESLFINNKRPYADLSDKELAKLWRKVCLNIYKQLKLKKNKIAREFKALFIDNLTVFELFSSKNTTTPQETIKFLKRQRDWEIKHKVISQSIDEIADYYERIIKQYKFFKNV